MPPKLRLSNGDKLTPPIRVVLQHDTFLGLGQSGKINELITNPYRLYAVDSLPLRLQ